MNAAFPALPSVDRVREALVDRRERVRDRWCGTEGGLDDGFVLVPSGLALEVEGSDQHYAYRAHDDYYYLSGCRLPGEVLACDPQDGEGGAAWTLFAYVATQEDRVWLGAPPDPETRAETVGVGRVRPLAELGAWLGRRAQRPVAPLGSRDLLERPGGYGLHPDHVGDLAFDADVTERLQRIVVDARRRKDAVELDLMRAAAAASQAGHLAGMRAARAGMTERALRVEIDTAFLRAGAERSSYATIAVAGEHCAVLHATPGDDPLRAGDLVLVDAAAEVAGYDSDVTRTWPVDARFTPQQRAIYEIVLAVQERAVAGARAGVEYRELHMEACRGLAEGLVDFGLLRGSPDALVERDTHALFFPHGLGHLLGLATHDVGGYAAGRQRSKRPGLEFLRTDLPLRDGYVVTIEPGIYFVRALLQDAKLRREHHDAVNWAQADAMLGFGGVRIEDDVVVRDGEPEILTTGVPKQVDEVEALRA